MYINHGTFNYVKPDIKPEIVCNNNENAELILAYAPYTQI